MLVLLVTPFAIALPARATGLALPHLGGPLVSLHMDRLRTGVPILDWPLFHVVLPMLRSSSSTSFTIGTTGCSTKSGAV